MSDILIRRIPADAIRLAKALAARHRHSLQEEISNILIETIRFRAGKWSVKADAVRKRLSRKRRPYSNTTDLLRRDRGR